MLLWLLVVLTGDMRVRFDELHSPPLSLDVALIPYYTARTVLRMFIAFAAALLFTFTYGYVAAKSVRARKVMLPLLDILQSVPVLGFLSITVTGFLALFPGSLLGVECASIFAIFTAQAWNMTFGFYHSLITIPAELQEAASVYRHEPLAALHQGRVALVRDRPDVELDDELRRRLVLRRAKRSHFRDEQEHQAARTGVVHGGGGRSGRHARRRLRHRGDDHHYRRPRSALWRPLVAWAEKFKLEQTEGKDNPTSWVLDLLRRSYVLAWFSNHVGHASEALSQRASVLTSDLTQTISGRTPAPVKALLRMATVGTHRGRRGVARLRRDRHRQGDQDRHDRRGDAARRRGSACLRCFASWP